MRAIVTVLLIATLGLAGCTGIPVSTDYDTSRDFNALKTFAWMTPKQKLVQDPLVDNDLMNQRIQRSVESELQRRGYQKADGDSAADFFITYHVKAEDKISAGSFHSSYGYYPCWHGCFGLSHAYEPDIHIRQYKQGTFMLDVVDPATQKLMWRGSAGRRLQSGTPGERDAFVQGIVAAILAKFPPGAQ